VQIIRTGTTSIEKSATKTADQAAGHHQARQLIGSITHTYTTLQTFTALPQDHCHVWYRSSQSHFRNSATFYSVNRLAVYHIEIQLISYTFPTITLNWQKCTDGSVWRTGADAFRKIYFEVSQHLPYDGVK
jgi:hypothetical protein